MKSCNFCYIWANYNVYKNIDGPIHVAICSLSENTRPKDAAYKLIAIASSSGLSPTIYRLLPPVIYSYIA